MKRLLILLLLSLCQLHAEDPVFPSEPQELIVHNRILAKVNEKTISVVDVMKKMDLALQRNYPDLIESKVARYQFYSSQWRDFLTQMIDNELMLADAEKLEVKVTDAEVREEVMTRFGPNIMPILDAMGVSYEEARQMIHDEMIVQRMMWFRVNSKALTSVNSQDVKKAYRLFCEKNPGLDQWEYEVLSIRSKEKEASEALASRAMQLLDSKADFASLAEELKTEDETVTISLSPEMNADERSISTSHKEVLKTLGNNTFSQPIAQVSRADNSVVYRIFHLKNHTRSKLPPFQKISEQIREQLLQHASSKEHAQYMTKLRERLGYDEKHMKETLPSDFQPFALR